MDSRTHVELANQLLSFCHARPALAVVSLFPQIDRWPHTLHRMYAHSVFKARPIAEIGLRVLADATYGAEGADAGADNEYEVSRFKDERARLLAYLSLPSWQPATDAGEREATLMAYVSHLYLDTYNQPTQPYSPLSVYCSGQWQLWEVIGDFRRKLYTTSLITELRNELFANSLWQGVGFLSAVALMQAMMLRMCHHSLGKIETDLVAVALQSMEISAAPPSDLARANEFLGDFEALLNKLHIQHLGTQLFSFSATTPAAAAELA